MTMTSDHPYFSTPRLQARRFLLTDLDAFVEYRADPNVARFQSWSDYTVEQGRALIESMAEIVPGAPGQWYQFALENTDGALVGDVALHVNETEAGEAEFGFTISPEHQGKGYGAEAVRGLLNYAFGSLRLRRLIAITDALNAPAGALLGRVGMRQEAHYRENIFFKGAWGSEFLFAILNHEWAALNAAPATVAP